MIDKYVPQRCSRCGYETGVFILKANRRDHISFVCQFCEGFHEIEAEIDESSSGEWCCCGPCYHGYGWNEDGDEIELELVVEGENAYYDAADYPDLVETQTYAHCCNCDGVARIQAE